MTEISFTKMHGLGNDFVIIDTREQEVNLSKHAIQVICDRRFGVGCDQLVTLHKSDKANCVVRFFNGDGSESGACGNASRCVAALMMYESGRSIANLETKAGILRCDLTDDGWVTVNMGKVNTDWQQIPLREKMDTLHVDITQGKLSDAVAVNVGNPHAVFFVDDVDHARLKRNGSVIESHPLFPERTNVEVVQIISRSHIKMRVWERGSGETMACGSGACAGAVAAARRDLCDRTVTVELPGGDLEVTWHTNGEVCLSGPIGISFAGVMDEAMWAEEEAEE